MSIDPRIIDRPQWRNRTRIFRDRSHAGEVLAQMLQNCHTTDTTVSAIPAGGVPVAAVIAERLKLPLAVTVVSKITLPWNTEVGYGAVAFDGTVIINDQFASALGLTQSQIAQGIDETSKKVSHRVHSFQAIQPPFDFTQRSIILVDDGLASGFTIRVAVKALRNAGVKDLVLAVPTAHAESLRQIAVETIYCPNLRQGPAFAVADAYQRWSDVSQAQALATLAATAPKPSEHSRK